MSSYVKYETPGGVILVHVEDPVGGPLTVTASQEEAFASFQDVAHALTVNARFLQGMLAELAPSGIEISFGIKAGIEPGPFADSGTAVFGLAKGVDEANYSVKLTWEAQDDKE